MNNNMFITDHKELLGDYILYSYDITRNVNMVISMLINFVMTGDYKTITKDYNFRRRFYYSGVTPQDILSIVNNDLEGYVKDFLKQTIGLEEPKTK